MSEPRNGGVKTLGIKVPDSLHAQFALVAQLDGISLGDAALRAVELYVAIHISQGDIRSLDKGDNLSSGGQLLYTGTSTTAWQSYWNGGPISHGTIALFARIVCDTSCECGVPG